MARTKQTACKSTGGKAASVQLAAGSQRRPRTLSCTYVIGRTGHSLNSEVLESVDWDDATESVRCRAKQPGPLLLGQQSAPRREQLQAVALLTAAVDTQTAKRSRPAAEQQSPCPDRVSLAPHLTHQQVTPTAAATLELRPPRDAAARGRLPRAAAGAHLRAQGQPHQVTSRPAGGALLQLYHAARAPRPAAATRGLHAPTLGRLLCMATPPRTPADAACAHPVRCCLGPGLLPGP